VIGDILQPTHLLFVLAVALLVLGPKRLPEVGRALGRGLRDFRSAISGEEPPEHVIPPATEETAAAAKSEVQESTGEPSADSEASTAETNEPVGAASSTTPSDHSS
jgi:sec-independent protein translocase protein TatA